IVESLQLPELRLHLAVAELEAAHLLATPVGRIEPAHALVAESVTRLAPLISTRLAHRRAAIVLSQDGGENSSRLWECAEHWCAAGEAHRAAEVFRQCAQMAVRIGRPREAAETLLRAATMLSGRDTTDLIREAVLVADRAGEADIAL